MGVLIALLLSDPVADLILLTILGLCFYGAWKEDYPGEGEEW